LRRYLIGWAFATALLCAVVYARNRVASSPLPDAAASGWAYAALQAARSGAAQPAPPLSATRYRAAGPVFVSVYAGGTLRARQIGSGSLVEVVRAAAAGFARDPALQGLRAWRTLSDAGDALSFRVAVTRASAPLTAAVPGLEVFSLVPLLDGVSATLAERSAYLTPDDLLERNLTDRAVIAPVPDLTFGTDLAAVKQLLASELDTSVSELARSGHLARLRIEALPEQSASTRVNRANLLRAARDGVAFVLRHQEASGRFTYVYDAQHDESIDAREYNLARHAGTIFFLARAARQLGMPEARVGALRGIAFLRETALAECGATDRSCIVQSERAELGSSALSALACAELLRGGDDAGARALLQGLLGFVRAQQRPDGELMHEYDRAEGHPIDVQRMYYSGEGAMALLAGFEQLGDRRDLEAASKLMAHLTGAGWGFFGARYYYGEEHWTCQAVAKAAAHMPVGSALDFCLRWGRWQERLQYRAGQTPWSMEGSFGVGPVLLPRVTTAASRIEALVPIYRVAKPRGLDVSGIRDLVERSLGLLLRVRWAPGPAHLFARPQAAIGGIPGTAADLRSRVDMVQHAGSAMLAWAELLELGPVKEAGP
jgi:hypothetical protein